MTRTPPLQPLPPLLPDASLGGVGEAERLWTSVLCPQLCVCLSQQRLTLLLGRGKEDVLHEFHVLRHTVGLGEGECLHMRNQCQRRSGRVPWLRRSPRKLRTTRLPMHVIRIADQGATARGVTHAKQCAHAPSL